MDFVESIGQRYLRSKANAVPQQLEDLVKKQVKGDTPAVKADPTVQSLGKDNEIAELKKQLAEARINQEDRQTKRKPSAHSEAKKPTVTKPQKQARSVSGGSAKPKLASSTHGPKRKEKHGHATASEQLRRGRLDSIKTAVAARLQSNNHHRGHEEAHEPRSTNETNAPEDSKAHDEKLYSANHIAFTRPVYREMVKHSSSQSKRLEHSEPAADLCVVEVTEEQPRRQRPTHSSRANVIEVIERDRHRTRYIVR